jgi:hypothetical protein
MLQWKGKRESRRKFKKILEQYKGGGRITLHIRRGGEVRILSPNRKDKGERREENIIASGITKM